ncbi:right-handed parallel beta-helix repeat-containing protein [bacterium]|nr:right-handed parallel beta-helix repeat-containing protein [bacterium]
MRYLSIVVCLLVAFVSSAAINAQPSGSVSYLSDEGINADSTIGSGLHRFHFELRADEGSDDILGFGIYFEISSPDGANWSSLAAETTPELNSLFDLGVNIDLSNADGSGIDTIGFTGLASVGNGIVGGSAVDGLVIEVDLGPSGAGNHGKSLCVDTVNTADPLGSSWRWQGGTVPVVWNQTCFSIVDGLENWIVTRLEDDGSFGSLRYAIAYSESIGGGTVFFATSGTIMLVDSLPVITTPIHIKGESSPSGIVLNGQSMPAGTSIITAKRVTQLVPYLHVSGVEICNGMNGIQYSNGAMLVEDCYIHDCQIGITMVQPGPTDPLPCIFRRNVISGNLYGLLLYGCCHDIEDNFFGTSIDGMSFNLNQTGIYFAAPEVSDLDILRNVICASQYGLYCAAQFHDNDVVDNLIGLNANGTASCGGEYGIYGDITGENVLFPGNNLFDGNTISGHSQFGVRLYWGYSPFPNEPIYENFNVFTGNRIGTDPTGLIAMPNQGGGLYIGPPTPGAGIYGPPVEMTYNVISGNGGPGVILESMGGVTLAHNKIGVAEDFSAALPNNGPGIKMTDVVEGRIGHNPGLWNWPNYIRYNRGYGIEMVRCSSCVISANVIALNEGGGMLVTCPSGYGGCGGNDLTDNIVYNNGSVEGGLDVDIAEAWEDNGGIAPARLGLYYSGGDGWCVTGWGPAGATIKLYLARNWEPTFTASGVHPLDSGGSIYSAPIGTTVCDLVPDGSGRYPFVSDVCGLDVNANTANLSEYDIITALAVGEGGTSQFSKNVAVQSFIFVGLSPVELVLIDPQGDSCGSGFNTIPGAEYDAITDVNDDGDPDDRVILDGHLFGDYTIRVIRRPEAQPGDTYTLLSVLGDDSLVLAEEEPVPAEGDTATHIQSVSLARGCCVGTTGNVNDDPAGQVDLSDLITLVNYLFLGGAQPPCLAEANVNGDLVCAVDLSDLIHLVNYLFLGGPPPAECGSCP